MKKPNLKSRSLRMGSMSTVLTIVFLAAIVVINVIATILVQKYPLKVDLTATGAFKISAESIDYAKSIGKPVNIYILENEADFIGNDAYFAQANEVIQMYGRYSENVTVEYVDYVKNPQFTAKYSDLKLQMGDILVECEGRTKVVSPLDLFNYNYDSYGQRTSVSSSKAEQVMTSAIVNVTTEDKVVVSILKGFGEYDMPAFTELLDSNNYEVITQNLVTEDINPAASFAVMISPTVDYSPEALAKLDAFLENNGQFGKTVLYFADTTQGATPNLDTFLSEWGIAVGDGAIYETDDTRMFQYNPYYATVNYIDEDFRALLRDQSRVFAMALGRPLAQLFESRDTYSTRLLLEYGKTAELMPTEAPAEGTALQKGPFPAMILSSKTVRGTDNIERTSRVLASSSTAILTDTVLENTSLSDAEYLINFFNKQSDRGDVITVMPKSLANTTLNINVGQANTMGVIFAVVIPLGVLVFGIVLWMRRRHK